VETGYGELDPREVMRVAIPSVSMMLLGMECCLASFFLGILRIGRVERPLQRSAGEYLPTNVI